MAEIFGFDQDELFRMLAKVLNDVEKKQKERDKDGPPSPMSDPDNCLVRENRTETAKDAEASRLYIYANLVGTSVSTIDVRITIT